MFSNGLAVGFGGDPTLRLSLVTAPVSEPVSLDEAKAHCRIETTDEDAQVEAWIAAARERIEIETGRQLMPATWELRLDAFPACDVIDVPRPPLIHVVAIRYVDPAGQTQTLAADQYRVDAPSGPTAARGRITPAYGRWWPATQAVISAVTVTFDAGYDSGCGGSGVPFMLRHAMLMYLTDLSEQRGDTVELTREIAFSIIPLPFGVRAMLRPYWARPTGRSL